MADTGRDLVISIAATAVAGAQTNSISLDNSPVDISSISSGGYRQLGNFSGNRKLDLSISGVWTDAVARAAAFASEAALLMTDVTLDFADGASIAGNFYLASYTEEGSHDGAVTFTASLQSSGAFTYTAV
jgi:predicted secreted protein|tara:strand:+ start:2320 stop:2709 length:390 start_codon:yes stop_codon:yes gene_type:complete